jgi:hypothetical protein
LTNKIDGLGSWITIGTDTTVTLPVSSNPIYTIKNYGTQSITIVPPPQKFVNFVNNDAGWEVVGSNWVSPEVGKQYICKKNNEEQRVEVKETGAYEAVVALIKDCKETPYVKIPVYEYEWELVESVSIIPHKEEKKYEVSCEDQYELLVW